jgi:hypothetical protein
MSLSGSEMFSPFDALITMHLDSSDTSNQRSNSKYSPAHYQGTQEGTPVTQTWDYIHQHNLDYFLGNVVKYVSRAGKKPNEPIVDDLLKAKAYLDKAIHNHLNDVRTK